MPSPNEFPDFSIIAGKPEYAQEQERREKILAILEEAKGAIEVIRYPRQRALEYCRMIAVAHGLGCEMPGMLQKAERILDTLLPGRDQKTVQDAIEKARDTPVAKKGERHFEEMPRRSPEDIYRALDIVQTTERKTELQFSLARTARIAQEAGGMTEEIAERMYTMAKESEMNLETESSIPFLTNLGGVHIREAMNIVDKTRVTPAGKKVIIMKIEDRIRYKIAAFYPRLKSGEPADTIMGEILMLLPKISPDPHGHFKAARLGSLADALILGDIDPRPTLQTMMESYKKSTGDSEQSTFIGWVLDRYFAYATRIAQG